MPPDRVCPSDRRRCPFDQRRNASAGEPSWIRTSDLLIKSQLLYRLSYGPDQRGPVTCEGGGGQGDARNVER